MVGFLLPERVEQVSIVICSFIFILYYYLRHFDNTFAFNEVKGIL